MPWVAALIGGGVSLYEGSQAGKTPAQTPSGAIASTDAERSAQLYDQYQKEVAPRLTQNLNSVFDDSTSPGAQAARAEADARSASTSANASSLRNARSLGINPSSPAFQGISTANQANTAGLEAAAQTTARQNAVTINAARQGAAVGLGNSLVPQSEGYQTGAAGLYTGLDAVQRGRDAASGQLYGQGLANLIKGGTGAYKAWSAPDQPNASNTAPTSTGTNIGTGLSDITTNQNPNTPTYNPQQMAA